jgi:hypothetical protein
MNIYYEFIGYVGSVFTNENEVNVNYETIKDNFFNLDGRKGKLIYQGYTSVYEHGYSGGYENYGFVFQDDLSSVSLDKHSGKILLEAVT